MTWKSCNKTSRTKCWHKNLIHCILFKNIASAIILKFIAFKCDRCYFTFWHETHVQALKFKVKTKITRRAIPNKKPMCARYEACFGCVLSINYSVDLTHVHFYCRRWLRRGRPSHQFISLAARRAYDSIQRGR